MSCFRRVVTPNLALLGTLLMQTAQANAFELSGAWATAADMCSRVFTKRASTIEFAELSDLFGSGFVIDNDRIRGKAAKCTIDSRKQDGENIELAASCATSIMNQSVRFILKVVDDDTITRIFPEIPGMVLNYSRCKF
jgi:hypothetical protein